MTPKPLYNTMKVIDSREVIERIAYLESLIEPSFCGECQNEITFNADAELPLAGEGHDPECAGCDIEFFNIDSEELDELNALKELQEECGSSDWVYGCTLVNDDYFTEYTKELANETTTAEWDTWPINCIDWEDAARELQYDYSSADFNGVSYWYWNG